MTITYGPTSQDNQQDLDGDKRNYSLKMLSSFVMVGEQIGIAKFYLKAGDSVIPTGTMYATIYSDDGSIRSTSTGIDMSNLTTSFAWYEFCFTSRPEIAADDYVSFTATYTGNSPGSGYGYIAAGRDSSGAGSDVELWIGGTGSPDDLAQESSGRQPTLELTTDTCTPVSSGGTRLPPPPLIASF